MKTKTAPLHPDFEIRGDKIHCLHCARWSYTKWIDKAFSHETLCPSKAKSPADSAKKVPSVADIHAAAKAGEISRVLSDDEIVDAVAVGVVTMDDAMNRDF